MQINDSSVKEIEEEGLRRLESDYKYILQQLELAAIYEQQNHKYKSRTGNLQNSTQVIVNGDELELAMTADYAQDIVDRGLSDIGIAEEIAEQNIDSLFNS